MSDLPLHPGILAACSALAGVVIGLLVLRRARARPAPAIVEPDGIDLLKDTVSVVRQWEDELIAAGQTLGRVRRFLEDPSEADPHTQAVKQSLAELWLWRHDLEGHLRLALLRRRIPAPPSAHALTGALDTNRAVQLISTLSELIDDYVDLADRAEESARAFRRQRPSQDSHARYVSDAVDQAVINRKDHVEAILRFAGRTRGHSETVAQARQALAELLPKLAVDRPRLENTGPGTLFRGMPRLGLEDRVLRGCTWDQAALDDAINRASEASREARDMARVAAAAGKDPSADDAPDPASAPQD